MARSFEYPVGFVVEGVGEYHAFNALFSKATGYHAFAPRSRPQGYGRILKNLEQELTDLVSVYSVAKVVVCIDLKDVLRNKHHGFSDCASLREHLQTRADMWLESAGDDGRIAVVPLIRHLASKQFHVRLPSTNTIYGFLYKFPKRARVSCSNLGS